MNRDDVTWRGYFPACPTPFAPDGSFAPELLTQLLEFYVGAGLHGVLINGTTGEWFSQTPDERRLVAETALAAVAGRIPVIVGCTGYTADEVAGYARHAMAAGAAGVASTPPPYAKPFPAEIEAFYTDIARTVDAPLMIYNWPHGTSVDIGPELASRLVDIDTVVALKDSTPDAQQFFATNRAVNDRVRVFGPFMTTPGHAALCADGGDGTIGGGSLFGAPDGEFWEAHWRGEHGVCLAHAQRIDRLFPRLWLDGGWAGHYGHYSSQLKALMALLGQPGGEVRRPRLPVTDPESLRALHAILVDEGLPARDPVSAER
jgi:4-hydroxy-tetrahydrodipicolinate synthase